MHDDDKTSDAIGNELSPILFFDRSLSDKRGLALALERPEFIPGCSQMINKRCYAPTELEVLMRRELEKAGEDAAGIRLQIFRRRRGWLAKCSTARPARAQDELARIDRKLKRLSMLTSPNHRLIGE